MKKIALLLQTGQKIFHLQDLQKIWCIKNANTLRITVSRYMKKGVLFQLYRGLYSIQPLSTLHPFEVATSIANSYCYISTETILAKEGIIMQNLSCITVVSSISKTCTLNNQLYKVRKMKDEYLYQTKGIIHENGYLQATKERAVLDMLYFDKTYHFDNPPSFL